VSCIRECSNYALSRAGYFWKPRVVSTASRSFSAHHHHHNGESRQSQPGAGAEPPRRRTPNVRCSSRTEQRPSVHPPSPCKRPTVQRGKGAEPAVPRSGRRESSRQVLAANVYTPLFVRDGVHFYTAQWIKEEAKKATNKTVPSACQSRHRVCSLAVSPSRRQDRQNAADRPCVLSSLSVTVAC
jgi:hypothetical protein